MAQLTTPTPHMLLLQPKELLLLLSKTLSLSLSLSLSLFVATEVWLLACLLLHPLCGLNWAEIWVYNLITKWTCPQ
jgi:hypothetical protein